MDNTFKNRGEKKYNSKCKEKALRKARKNVCDVYEHQSDVNKANISIDKMPVMSKTQPQHSYYRIEYLEYVREPDVFLRRNGRRVRRRNVLINTMKFSDDIFNKRRK